MSIAPEQEVKAPRIFFDAVLTPHRSLAPRGFLVIMAALGGISFVGAIVAWLVGALPVVPFLGLDVALVYIAFRLNYRAARQYETIRLTDSALEVRRINADGAERRWTFEPAWVRVLLEGEARRPRLVLAALGRQSLQIGAFMPPHERRSLAEAIKDALAARQTALPHL